MRTKPTAAAPSIVDPKYLTADQVNQFDTEGYLHLPGFLPAGLLENLRGQADRLLQEITEAASAPDNKHPLLEHVSLMHSFARPFVHMVHSFHLAAGEESLELLGYPGILKIAEDLCGPNFISTGDALVTKHKYDKCKIDWHQDYKFPSPAGHRSFAMGIYLDDSMPGDGAVQFIPRTQDKRRKVAPYIETPPDNIIELDVKAGDVLLHDLLLLHRAGRIRENARRRTIYHEFHSMEQVEDEEDWPEIIMRRRMDLLATSLENYRIKYPDREQYKWNIAPKWRSDNVDADLWTVYKDKVKFDNAVYHAAEE
ncbi:MAG: phytanoyl-CoA dioxygenase family protein [Kordiimonadaceae bacterium]|nr:phytanoyl-CoA dioxygenase family protein [Kordiimonadaceae bacterium]